VRLLLAWSDHDGDRAVGPHAAAERCGYRRRDVRLVFAAVPFALLTVAQKIAVKLFQVILGEGNIGKGKKGRLHDLIASYLLFVTAIEALDFQFGEELLDLAIAELAALDAGRRSDALDRRHMP